MTIFTARLKTEEIFKGKSNDPVVEGTTFGWVIHGGEYPVDECLFTTEVADYERLYSLDVLGIEDRKENDQDEVLLEFTENITRKADGRYEVNIPWIEGSKLRETNLEQSRRRLRNVEKRLNRDDELSKGYEEIVEEQLDTGIVEFAPRGTNWEKNLLHASQACNKTKCNDNKDPYGI